MSEMNNVQKNLYQLLKEFDEICKKHDIEYFIAAGNALGAIRNNQFLPWDDDIDVYIKRDEWNRFKALLESEENILPEGRSFVYNENTEYYYNTLPRYVNNNTTSIYKSQALIGECCVQNIELFILDPMPKDEKAKEEYVDLFRVYTELLTPYYVVNFNLTLDEWERHYELFEKYCQRIDDEGREKVIKELEEELQSYPLEECDSYCMRWGNYILIFEKEWFEKGREEKFEDDYFPIAEKAESALRVNFGDDWMYVPKDDKQIVHGGIKDINVPLSQYTDIYIKKINRESLLNRYRKNKLNNASLFYKREKNRMLVAKANAILKSKKICEYLDSKEDYLDSLLKDKDYITLKDEFDDYSKLQLSKNIRKNNIMVPISDKNLKTLLLSLTEQGKYFVANKYLEIRKAQEIPLDDEFDEIRNMMSVCRKLSIARYDEKDPEKVIKLIEEYKDKYPNLLDIHRSLVWVKEMDAKSMEDFKEIDDLCEEVLNSYPFDGETMAYQARAKSECGNEDKAMELYKKSIENTRNGLIWKKVEEESGISRIAIEREMIIDMEEG